jgi:hypothetical protein
VGIRPNANESYELIADMRDMVAKLVLEETPDGLGIVFLEKAGLRGRPEFPHDELRGQLREKARNGADIGRLQFSDGYVVTHHVHLAVRRQKGRKQQNNTSGVARVAFEP